MKERKIGAMDIVLCALSLALTLGVALIFKPCEMHEGAWMTCHWAGQAVLGVGVALCALAAARLFMGAKAKMGTDAAFIAFGALAAATPGHLIGLCMMAGMRCRALMQPAVVVLSVLICAAAVADIFVQKRRAA